MKILELEESKGVPAIKFQMFMYAYPNQSSEKT